MSTRQFGLAAVLTFLDKGASAGMGRVGSRVDALKKKFGGLGDGLKQTQRGFGQVAMAGAPIGAAFAFATRDGLKFEQAIANLKAVTLDTTNKTTPKLEAMAQTMGATTVFSASQAADAMTNLARAGLTTDEIMGAIPGTLAAAAAEGIDLATAADLVSSNMRAFGLDASQAGAIAGKLALASARTNTSMVEMQEGMKFAAAAARPYGVELSQVAATLGALADVGIKGTLGGTALRQMFARLAKPTKEMKGGFGELGLSIEDVNKFLGKGELLGLMNEIVGRLGKFEDRTKKASVGAAIFGVRAQSLANAFDLSGTNAARFNETVQLLGTETGKTAKDMASLQIDTTTGQFTLLMSAVEALNIQIFKLFGSEAKSGITGIASTIGSLALAMRVVRGERITDTDTLNQIKELDTTFIDVATGIKEGITGVVDAFSGIIKAIGPVGEALGLEGGAKGVTKLVTQFALLAAAIAPIAVALLGVKTLVGGFANIGIGVGKSALALGRGATGIVGGLLSGKGLLGKVAGAAGGAMDANAQPVRVVNFHEMGGGLGGVGKGQLSLPGFGGGVGGPAGKATSALGRFASAVGKAVTKIPILGPALASLGNVASSVGSKLAGSLLGKAGLVGAAGAAGFALGTWADKTFGLSDKISNAAFKLFGPSGDLTKKEANAPALANAQKMAEMFASMADRGVGSLIGDDGTKENLTAAAAENRITSFLVKQGITGEQLNATLAGLQGTLARIDSFPSPLVDKPSATGSVGVLRDGMLKSDGYVRASAGDMLIDRRELASAVGSRVRGGLLGNIGLGQGDPGRVTPAPQGAREVTIPVTVQVDGREIALAVARVKLDDMERSGTPTAPGDRGSLTRRGFTSGGSRPIGGL